MRIGLVMPAAPFLLNERVNYPYGIACLSSYMKAHGYATTVLHPTAHNDEQLAPLLDCDIVGVSTTTPLYHGACEILAWVKQHKPKTRVVLGGPHATGIGMRCLPDGWDTVITGEGELALLHVVEHGIDGIYWSSRRIADLGSLPFPDFEGAKIRDYHWTVGEHVGTDLHTTRGCVYACRFCNNQCSWGRRLYGYPAWYVKRIIDQLHEEYGFRGCMVQDDAFPLRKKVFREITDYFVRRGWVYRCQLRADQLTGEMAKRLQDTGCIGVGIGIESMVQAELDAMGKGTTVTDNERCLTLCARYKLPVTAYLMLGVPKQTRASAQITLDAMLQYRPERVHPGMLCPYPGTAFYDEREQWGIHFRDDDEARWIGNPYKANPFETQSPVYTDWMTAAEIEAVKDAYWKHWPAGFYAHDQISGEPGLTRGQTVAHQG